MSDINATNTTNTYKIGYVSHMTQDNLKKAAANAAIQKIEPLLESTTIVGVGTGSTTNFFIDALAEIKHKFDGAVASSVASAKLLKAHHIPVYELNTVNAIAVYVDGADESNRQLQLIKGGGGALTREKIIAAVAEQFICIVDDSKLVDILGAFPLPVEVIPMARSYVARELVKLGGVPEYRQGFITDNNNIIIDVYNLNINKPLSIERSINNITGVVSNGLFAQRPADLLLVSSNDGVKSIELSDANILNS